MFKPTKINESVDIPKEIRKYHTQSPIPFQKYIRRHNCVDFFALITTHVAHPYEADWWRKINFDRLAINIHAEHHCQKNVRESYRTGSVSTLAVKLSEDFANARAALFEIEVVLAVHFCTLYVRKNNI